MTEPSAASRAPATPPEVPGLAAERTALAWRRTLLSFTAACLVAGQTLPGADGFRTLALAAAVALVLTPPGWWFARSHARHTERHLRTPVPRLRHGRRIAIICGATSALGVGGLTLVLVP
ncbi:hypothetical protein GCM10023216_03950 [Isoptericola chiayiensis]|uniref:DUF202 domain-containing protein n=1 Tax=Isoptericola chiayiensis TaxID=579446 RepID=A0ABP8Y3C3_9MICO|nr:DUF202 domain-containing protein [Isoptericola chiayiensis]NOW01212.1 putative membrane protein [Isoptericola chiayiensis]